MIQNQNSQFKKKKTKNKKQQQQTNKQTKQKQKKSISIFYLPKEVQNLIEILDLFRMMPTLIVAAILKVDF